MCVWSAVLSEGQSGLQICHFQQPYILHTAFVEPIYVIHTRLSYSYEISRAPSYVTQFYVKPVPSINVAVFSTWVMRTAPIHVCHPVFCGDEPWENSEGAKETRGGPQPQKEFRPFRSFKNYCIIKLQLPSKEKCLNQFLIFSRTRAQELPENFRTKFLLQFLL